MKSKAPNTSTFVQPVVKRTGVEWTPEMIKAARIAADGGNLQLAADFCEFAMSDERVSSALATRANGLLSLSLKFEPARGGMRAVKALEAGEDWWAAYPASDASQLVKWGILLGAGLAKHVWTDRGLTINRLVPKLEVWHPRHLKRDTERGVWQVQTTKGLIDITPGDGKWVLYTPYGSDRPHAFGAWNAIAFWTLLKLYAIEDWGDYSSKTGRGNLVASTPENFDKDKRREVALELFGVDGSSSIALPAGVTLDLLESTASNWQTFEAQINASNAGKSIAILGQNLSTEVSGPVATGATLHSKVLQVYIDMDAETFTSCIHDQSLTWWADINFGSKDLAPWPIYNTKPPEDQKALAEMFTAAATALNTLTNSGSPVDPRAFLERFGIPLRDPKDIEQGGQVYQYHLQFGVLTKNEIRERLGLPPVKGGDEPPTPMALNAAGTESASDSTKAFDDTRVLLKSGRTVRANSGIVQGQAYVDRLIDEATKGGAAVLSGDVIAVVELVKGAKSLEEIRDGLTDAYKAMSPEKLQEFVAQCMVLGELAGMHAVMEDVKK